MRLLRRRRIPRKMKQDKARIGEESIMLQLYNSLTNQKEPFEVSGNQIRIYACGPTVYNFFHVGNGRSFMMFDTLRRYLEFKGYEVTYVQNFTDVDDKMIRRAAEEGISVADVAEKYIREYFTDADGLNIKRATIHPRATENIDPIIDLVSTLIEKGHAYESNGDVYFRVRSFPKYGESLLKQSIEDLESGARIDISEIKQDPLDFALWKASKPGEPAWDSPWGKGRPGWHIECSAMAKRYLGNTIDIHCGGHDLKFPHHENEIAQSECANGCRFSRFWFHVGFVNVNNEKMSKSKNNFFTVRELSEVYGYLPLRYFAVSAHYRSPINYEPGILEQAKASLERIDNCLLNLKFRSKNAPEEPLSEEMQEYLSSFDCFRQQFIEAMDDDLNTANALTAIFDLIKKVNVSLPESASKVLYDTLYGKIAELTDVLGLLKQEPQEADGDEKIEQLIRQRSEARKAKDWKTADEIRNQLTEMGIVLEDTPAGIRWKRI